MLLPQWRIIWEGQREIICEFVEIWVYEEVFLKQMCYIAVSVEGMWGP